MDPSIIITGELTVTLSRGKDLDAKRIYGILDTYCSVSVGSTTCNSHTSNRGGQPQWNQIFKFKDAKNSDELIIKVKGRKLVWNDDIGTCRMSLSRVIALKTEEAALAVVTSNGKSGGTVYVQLEYKETNRYSATINILPAGFTPPPSALAAASAPQGPNAAALHQQHALARDAAGTQSAHTRDSRGSREFSRDAPGSQSVPTNTHYTTPPSPSPASQYKVPPDGPIPPPGYKPPMTYTVPPDGPIPPPPSKRALNAQASAQARADGRGSPNPIPDSYGSSGGGAGQAYGPGPAAALGHQQPYGGAPGAAYNGQQQQQQHYQGGSASTPGYQQAYGAGPGPAYNGQQQQQYGGGPGPGPAYNQQQQQQQYGGGPGPAYNQQQYGPGPAGGWHQSQQPSPYGSGAGAGPNHQAHPHHAAPPPPYQSQGSYATSGNHGPAGAYAVPTAQQHTPGPGSYGGQAQGGYPPAHHQQQGAGDPYASHQQHHQPAAQHHHHQQQQQPVEHYAQPAQPPVFQQAGNPSCVKQHTSNPYGNYPPSHNLPQPPKPQAPAPASDTPPQQPVHTQQPAAKTHPKSNNSSEGGSAAKPPKPPSSNGAATPPVSPPLKPPPAPAPKPSEPKRHSVRIKVLPDAKPGCWDYYTKGRYISQGGFGTVYEAVNNRTQEKVAVKVIDKNKLKDEQYIEDVRYEVKVMHHLRDHPNVVQLKDMYEDMFHIYLVLELCEGGDLSKVLRTEADASKVMRTIIKAIAHLHQLGVIHRDIKPENFLLSSPGESGVVKVADYGFAVFFKEEQQLSDMVGSPQYMAPEVWRGAYSKEADIWSCGVLLYLMLCGSHPFGDSINSTGDWVHEMRSEVLYKEIDVSSGPWKEVSDEAKALVLRMLKRDRRTRPTAKELLRDPWLRSDGVASVRNPIQLEVVKRFAKFSAMNKLAKAVFRVMAGNRSEYEVEGLRELFREIDKDGNGYLTEAEMKEAFRLKGEHIPQDQLRLIMERASEAGVSWDEFSTAMLNRSVMEDVDRLQQAFSTFDTDGNGTISLEELKQALCDPYCADKDRMTEAQVIQMMSDADKDGDGELSFDEFCCVVAQNHFV